jgi:hypothetical protein
MPCCHSHTSRAIPSASAPLSVNRSARTMSAWTDCEWCASYLITHAQDRPSHCSATISSAAV